MSDRIRFETMSNGYVFVQARGSGLRGMYETDGSYRHGDLRLGERERSELAARVAAGDRWGLL